ncbi:MAG: hypothetical protein K2M65_02070 [Muribaculaceae bacterium]|nr:hypothetical protein [Muribaculaceae bacterium]
MKKLILFLLVSVLCAGSVLANGRINLLDEQFSKVNGDIDNLKPADDSQFDNPDGWSLTGAYAGQGSVILKKGGTITTPPIATLTGNVAFFFSVRKCRKAIHSINRF